MEKLIVKPELEPELKYDIPKITFGDFGELSLNKQDPVVHTNDPLPDKTQILQQEIHSLKQKLERLSSLPKQNHKLTTELVALRNEIATLTENLGYLSEQLLISHSEPSAYLPLEPIRLPDRIVYPTVNRITGEIFYGQHLSEQAIADLSKNRQQEVTNTGSKSAPTASSAAAKPAASTNLDNSQMASKSITLTVKSNKEIILSIVDKLPFSKNPPVNEEAEEYKKALEELQKQAEEAYVHIHYEEEQNNNSSYIPIKQKLVSFPFSITADPLLLTGKVEGVFNDALHDLIDM